MRITYDTKADAMYIFFQDGQFICNKEIEPGIILDLGENDLLLGIEILDVSFRIPLFDIAKVEIKMPLELGMRQLADVSKRSE